MPVPTGNRESQPHLTETSLPFPPLTEQHILNCTFSSWYNNFRRVSIKSKIIKPLPEEFVEYLHADGVFLPEQNFPDLEQQIWDIIDEFDGSVFPKLNWSSPRDATWISATNTLKCNSPSDIFLLLKSSDFIAHDLDHAFDDCYYDNQSDSRRHRPNEFELVLRKWYDVAPSMEFRCFVKEEELVAISQRDVNYYSFLNDIKEELETKIIQFFETHVQNKFFNRDYVFDVYVTRNRERVWLIDFNPFGPMTDGLMYTWEEILTATGPPSFRLITSQTEASQSRSRPFAVNRYPREIFDLSQGQTIAEFAEQFQRELAIAVSSSDEEENDNEDNV
ncbi:D123-domain-containing protein [Rhizophagus irregularis]|uniref:D123-domain-containing protein n=1 Tax=Rhizophagus irregularis TaxID=588596 RepID=A0A2N1NNS1_9GLOM|nr:D123-domain-containing protein [Rhizophagus irregularis]